MAQVHYRREDGSYACGCNKRWRCTVITSIRNWAKVTCKRCLATKKG